MKNEVIRIERDDQPFIDEKNWSHINGDNCNDDGRLVGLRAFLKACVTGSFTIFYRDGGEIILVSSTAKMGSIAKGYIQGWDASRRFANRNA